MAQISEIKVLLVAIAGTFMVILDQTIMNVALPHIMTVFNETPEHAQLVVSAYMMSSAISTPAAAFLCERYGIRKVYLFSQIGFLAGSLLCGLSWDTNSLIFFRIIQGLCGGLLSPLAMTMLFTSVPVEDRGTAMSIFGIPMILGPAIGPTLGGYLVDYVGWRWCFYVNAPTVLLAIGLGYAWIENGSTSDVSLDWKGLILGGIGFSSLLYALSYAPTWGWDDVRVVTLLAGGFVFILVWVLVEISEKKPMLDLHIFKNFGFSLATGLNFITTIGLFSAIFLLPLYLQNLRGFSALHSGLMVLPNVLGSMVTMPIGGRLYDKIGPRFPAVTGLIITGIASLWLQVVDVNTPDELLRIILFTRGLGMGLVMMPVMTYALASVPQNLTAQASSLMNVTRMIFASLGIAVFATLLDHFHQTNLATLIQTVTPDSVEASVILSRMQVGLMQAGLTFDASRQAAINMLYSYVNQRASVTAFQMDYVISAIVLMIGIIPSFLLPHGKLNKAKGPMDISV